MKVSVITDSTSSLPPEMYERYGIGMVPYYVHLPDRVARDMVDLTPAAFNAYMEALADDDELPRTANPGPGEYAEAYLEAARESNEIISFHMTSDGSGAYQAAVLGRAMALKERPELAIEVVDTRNVSMCHGWLTLEAARLAEQGAPLAMIVEQVRRFIPRTRMLQTADTLRYLYMGGRIGRSAHLVGSLLHIKPIISMEDGVVVPVHVARTRMGAYRRIAMLVEKAAGAGARVKIALTHAAALADAETLRELVEQVVRPVEVLMCDLSPALTVHSGPGTVGLCYLLP
jgi:DegV family protein with EDD domain